MSLFKKDTTKDGHGWADAEAYCKRFSYPSDKPGFAEPKPGSNHPGNLILGQHTRLNLDTRKTFVNDNVFLLGSTGTGKSRYYVKPNLLQQNSSFVVYDPYGELLMDTSSMLKKAGYVVKQLNLYNPEQSDRYNPLAYIHSDSDLPLMIECITKNPEEGEASHDPFFNTAVTQLLCSVFYYIVNYHRECDKTIARAYDLILNFISKSGKKNENLLDHLMAEYEREDANATAVTNYKMFRALPASTALAVAMDACMKLKPFVEDKIKDVLSSDTIHLEELGTFKQAIFIIVPGATCRFRAIASMAITQMVAHLYRQFYENDRFMVKYDASCPIYSEPIPKDEDGNVIESEKSAIEARFINRVNRYLEHGLIAGPISVGSGSEKFDVGYSEGSTLKPLTRGPEDGPQARFDTNKQAEYFLKCIMKGKIVVGKPTLTSHVHMILDEFSDIGFIPSFDQIMATSRKYNLSFSILAQSVGQILSRYGKDSALTILGNCSTTIFFGTVNRSDAEWISRKLGGATIVTTEESNGRIKRSSHTRCLATPEEVLRMPSQSCMVMIDGFGPVLDEKFQIESHPNYSQLRER